MARLTDEQIQQARSVDLLSYLQTYAPHSIRRSGLNEYCLREHDSFKISNGLWHWWSRGVGGVGALDFLIKVEGMGFVDAVEHLTGRSITLPAPQKASPPKTRAPPKPFKLPEPNRNADCVYAYLRGRGIGKELIYRCLREGLLYESSRTHRCVFVGKDGDVPRFACERGTRDDWKKDVAGSDKRFSFHLPPSGGGRNELAVFEGPVDVLAHHEICRLKHASWDGYRLSLGGTSPLALTSFLERHPQITKLYLCLDNDEPGHIATKRIIEELSGDERFSHLRIAVAQTSVGKDYGETLEKMKQLNIQQSNRRQAEFLR